MHKTILLVGVCWAFLAANPAPATATKLSATEIMKRNDTVDDGEDQHSIMTMTLVNKHGDTRVRQVEMYRRDYGEDSKRLMYFHQPADIKGTALLTFSYDAPDQDDDQWLYIPELRKIKRISSKKKSGYFMGTDFTYVDMGDRDYVDYDYRLIGDEDVGGHDCYVVESLPKTKKIAKETGYGKTITWVRKDNFVNTRIDFYNRKGRFTKQLFFKDTRLVDGIWTFHILEMVNKKAEHRTTLEFSKTRYNTGFKEAILSKRALKQGL